MMVLKELFENSSLPVDILLQTGTQRGRHGFDVLGEGGVACRGPDPRKSSGKLITANHNLALAA